MIGGAREPAARTRPGQRRNGSQRRNPSRNNDPQHRTAPQAGRPGVNCVTLAAQSKKGPEPRRKTAAGPKYLFRPYIETAEFRGARRPLGTMQLREHESSASAENTLAGIGATPASIGKAGARQYP